MRGLPLTNQKGANSRVVNSDTVVGDPDIKPPTGVGFLPGESYAYTVPYEPDTHDAVISNLKYIATSRRNNYEYSIEGRYPPYQPGDRLIIVNTYDKDGNIILQRVSKWPAGEDDPSGVDGGILDDAYLSADMKDAYPGQTYSERIAEVDTTEDVDADHADYMQDWLNLVGEWTMLIIMGVGAVAYGTRKLFRRRKKKRTIRELRHMKTATVSSKPSLNQNNEVALSHRTTQKKSGGMHFNNTTLKPDSARMIHTFSDESHEYFLIVKYKTGKNHTTTVTFPYLIKIAVDTIFHIDYTQRQRKEDQTLDDIKHYQTQLFLFRFKKMWDTMQTNAEIATKFKWLSAISNPAVNAYRGYITPRMFSKIMSKNDLKRMHKDMMTFTATGRAAAGAEGAGAGADTAKKAGASVNEKHP